MQHNVFLWLSKTRGYEDTRLGVWTWLQHYVMYRDIELNRIDDMIIVIEPNRKISVGSHP